MKNKFQVEIDKDLKDLIPQFLANLNKDLNLMAEALANKNLGLVAQIAHRLRGDAPGYGFHYIGQICGQIEDLCCAQGLIETCHQHLSDLKNFVSSMEITFV